MPHPPVGLSAYLVILATSTSLLAESARIPVASEQQTGVFIQGDPVPSAAQNSREQGQTLLIDSFEHSWNEWRLKARDKALEDTTFKLNLRTYYFDRDKFDGTESQSFAAGGWVGLKTGYFLNLFSLGVTGYTSQHLAGADDKDGALLLKPGQESYTVLGEAYIDMRIAEDLNIVVGRTEFDSPFINRNDSRMTPNTFEAVFLRGKVDLGGSAGLIKYGAGYFNKIKERNSDEFVPMSEDAGASVERGVYALGGLYQNGDFSFGAVDYFSQDIINILYAEAKYALSVSESLKPRLALQFVDQRSTGDNQLQGESFAVQQYGIKAELPVGNALFTTAYTFASGDADLQNPWSGYPGFTSVQVENFNRAGEGALLLRVGYDLPWIEGLSAYALWVHGSDPDEAGQYAKDEANFNVQWAPTTGALKGLSARLRYGVVEERDSDSETLTEFRLIVNYALAF